MAAASEIEFVAVRCCEPKCGLFQVQRLKRKNLRFLVQGRTYTF